jgi:hypothetical protein
MHPVSASFLVLARGQAVCSTCAWGIVEAFREVYQAPEISSLDRIKFLEERGHEGWIRPQQASKNEPGWVYYIRMGELIKIGYSIDVAQRMRAYPPTAELLAAHPGTELLEKQIHQKFKVHLARGREWFHPHGDVMAHVDSVVAQFGDKTHLAYEYSKPKTQEERVAAMFAKPRSTADLARGVHAAW